MFQICRICLNVGDLISIFNDGDVLQLSTKMMSFTSLQIYQGDLLPSVVCYKCADKVNELYEFKIQCESSDSKLKEKISQQSTEINVKEKDDCFREYKYCGRIPDSDVPIENTSECSWADFAPSDESKSVIIEKNGGKTKKGKRKKKYRLPKREKRLTRSQSDVKLETNDDLNPKTRPDAMELGEIKIEKLSTYNSNEEKQGVLKIKKSSKPQKQQCVTCGKVMSSRFRLKMHMRTHTGERPFSCEYCPKKFALSQNLKVHERVHTGIKPLVCPTCGRAFAQSSGLVAHVRLHTGETPYKCVLCTLSFRTPGHLQYHVSRQHTGEKRHACTMCNRAFITRGDLTQHTRTHSGDRPHVCSVCGLRLGRASHLARHMLIHTGIKPHGCTVCEATYSQKGDLKRHMTRHATHTLQLANLQTAPKSEKPSDESKH